MVFNFQNESQLQTKEREIKEQDGDKKMWEEKVSSKRVYYKQCMLCFYWYTTHNTQLTQNLLKYTSILNSIF